MAALIDEDTLVSLSALLDGELDLAHEQALLARLEREPALQEALAELAELQQITHRVIGPRLEESDVLEAVLAALPAEATSGAAGAAALASLVADHEATPAQAARLEALARGGDAAAVIESLATIEATRTIAARPGAACSPALARVGEEIASSVAQLERGRALAAAAADGALDEDEVAELSALVRHDDALVSTLSAAVSARLDVAGADRAIGEALQAFAAAPSVVRLAERAGSAAVQALAASDRAASDRAASDRAAAPSSTNTKTSSTVVAVSWWSAVRQALIAGALPVAGAAAAALAFVIIGGDAARIDSETRLARLHEAQSALMAVLEPVALTGGMVSESTSLPVLKDNAADVQAIDAAGTTMVFETEASHITVIWVAGLDDDTAGEQGT
jgi:hypothetical protein